MKNIFLDFISFFRAKVKQFPDKREGRYNTIYKIKDITLSAFSVFFLQYQKNMEAKEGKSNIQSLFGLEKIPSYNHIRDIMDEMYILFSYLLFFI